MTEYLSQKEKEILRLLYKTYKQNANLYLDLAGAMADSHPDEVRKFAYGMHERQLLHCLDANDDTHILCRLTENGMEASKEIATLTEKIKHNKKTITIAVVVLLVLGVIVDMNSNIGSRFFAGSVSGLNMSNASKEILTEWIEQAEQENSDHYTYSLSDKEGTRRTFLVECKTEFISQCKYSIVFVDIDEAAGRVLGVEIPWVE